MKSLKLITGTPVACVPPVAGWILCTPPGNGTFGPFGNCIRFRGAFPLFLWRFKGPMKGSMLCETGVSATGIYIGLNGTWFPIPGPSLRGLGSGTGPSDPAELLARHP